MRTVHIALVHIFLWFGVAVYILLGALVFFCIEKTENGLGTNKTKASVFKKLSQEINYLEDDIQSNSSKIREIISRLRGVLKEVRDAATHEKGTDNEFIKCEQQSNRWTFHSAAVFAFSVVTTVGYGNVSLKTWLGKVFCVFYATIGIPFTVIAIADLGKCITNGLRSMHEKIILFYWGEYPQKSSESTSLSVMLSVPFLLVFLLMTILLTTWEPISFGNSAYFSFITLTTIGFGDFAPENPSCLPFTLLLFFVGFTFTTFFLEKAAEAFRKIHYAGQKIRNAKHVAIWIGGKSLLLIEVISAVCQNFGIVPGRLEMIDLDKVIEKVLKEQKDAKRDPLFTKSQALRPGNFQHRFSRGKASNALRFADEASDMNY